MNKILIVLACLLSSSTLRAQTEKIGEILEKNISADEKRILLSKPEIRKEIHYAIGSQLSKDWGTPSPERIAVADKVGLEISKNFDAIFKLAKTTNERQPYDLNILSLLSFSAPSEKIYTTLREEGERKPGFNDKKRELLYNIGALKPQDINEITKEFEDVTEAHRRRTLTSVYNDWGIPEVERHFAAQLASIEPEKANHISKFGYFTGGEFHSRVRTILNYYNHLGYLPDDVRKRINELKSYDSQVLGSKVPSYIKKTLMIADGELQKNLKLRKNGKGILDLSSLPEKITIPSADKK